MKMLIQKDENSMQALTLDSEGKGAYSRSRRPGEGKQGHLVARHSTNGSSLDKVWGLPNLLAFNLRHGKKLVQHQSPRAQKPARIVPTQ